MTISAARIRRPADRGRGGFTLLEIVVVVAIIALLAGGVITMLVYNSSTRKLQRAGRQVEALAKRARAIAILRQTPYALEFFDGKVRLSPLVEAGIEDPEVLEALAEEEMLRAEEQGAAAPNPPVRDEFVIEDEMVLGLRRWGSDDWIVFNNERNRMVWRFDPNGLCEPVAIRFELDEGESWLEQEYHPLTASVRDYGMVAQ